MKTPFFPIGTSVAAGILSARTSIMPVATGIAVILLIFFLFGGSVASATSDRPNWTPLPGALRTGAVLLLSFCAGAFGMNIDLLETNRLSALSRRLEGEHRIIRGRLCDIRARNAHLRSIDVCTRGAGRPHRVRLNLMYEQIGAHRVHEGDVVLLRGVAARPDRARNPYSFDEQRWLQSMHIYTLVEPADRLQIIHRHDTALFLRGRAKAWIERRIQARYSTETQRALIKALLLGDRGDIRSDVKYRFTRSGLMHLLALSGLHIGMIGAFIFLLIGTVIFRTRWSRSSKRYVVLSVWTLSMLGYGWIVGWPISVQRSLIMAGIVLGATTINRSTGRFNLYGLAATAVLLLHPASLFTAGFQLSFSAVGGLLLAAPIRNVHPALRARSSERSRILKDSMSASVAAGVATMPVLLFTFGRAPTSGIVLSPPSIVLMAPVLTSGIASVLLPIGARPFTAAGGLGLDLLYHMTGVRTPIFPVLFYRPETWSPFLLMGPMIACLGWRRGFRRRYAVLVVLAIAGCVCTLVRYTSSPEVSAHNIVFFDVGQGDAALFHFSNDEILVVDTGPKSAAPILGYLNAMGLDFVNHLVLTHPHEDHIAGAASILSSVRVGRIIHSGWNRSPHNIPLKTVVAGDTLSAGRNIRIDVLAPEDSERMRTNDRSIVLKIRIGDIRFLMMGDAEIKAEQALVRRYGAYVSADVVKVGHHGSVTSSSSSFILRSSPHIAVISAGKNNRFNHPSPTVTKRWKAAGATLHLTAADGAAWLWTDGRRIGRAWNRSN